MQKFIKNHVFSLIAWLLILVISIVALPNVNQLTRDHAEIKLPADTQTTIAQTFNNEWLSLIHISEPTRLCSQSRMPSSA